MILDPASAKQDCFQVLSIRQAAQVDERVAIDDHQICELAGFDAAGLIAETHQLGSVARRPAHHVEGRDAQSLDVEFQLRVR